MLWWVVRMLRTSIKWQRKKYYHCLLYTSDKGNTLTIMDTDAYNAKLQDFISDNNIRRLNSDPTDTYVKNLNNSINRCVHLFNESTRRYLKLINAKAPIFTGLPKIHKSNTPI